MDNLATPPSEKAIILAAKEMPVEELERIVDQVIAIRAERVAPRLSFHESDLLSRINQSLSENELSRMRELISKRDDEAISASEIEELTSLTDKLELIHADRLMALFDLARSRGTTVDEMMVQLGIELPDHD